MKSIKVGAIMISLFLLLNSCKKESSIMSVEIKPDNAGMTKIKDWYYSHHKERHSNLFGREDDESAAMPEGAPEWDSTHTYVQSVSIGYIIPMRFDKENSKANQLIIMKMDENGEIISGEYAYLVLDSTATNNYSKEDLERLTPEELELTNVPSNLTAWIMKFDINNEPILAKYLSNGDVKDSDLKFRTFSFNKAPLVSCDAVITIDWYYQIYVEGVLIWEDYVGSTNECVVGGGGGTSTGNNGTEDSQDETLMIRNDGHCTIEAWYTFTGYKFSTSTNNCFSHVYPTTGHEYPDFVLWGTAISSSDPYNATYIPLTNAGGVNNPNTTATTHTTGTLHYTHTYQNPQNIFISKDQQWQASTVFQ